MDVRAAVALQAGLGISTDEIAMREHGDGYTVWELSPNQDRRAVHVETIGEAAARALHHVGP